MSLKKTNFELIGSLQKMSIETDDLIKQLQLKQQKEALEELTQEEESLEYECDHEKHIDQMRSLIIKKEQQSDSLQDRLQNQITIKSREVENAEVNLKNAKRDLESVTKRNNVSETDKLLDLQDQVFLLVEENKQLKMELARLKRQQKEQAFKLKQYGDTDLYPKKISKLMEEVRVAKERNFELSGKLGNERLNLSKRIRRVEELEMSE